MREEENEGKEIRVEKRGEEQREGDERPNVRRGGMIDRVEWST